MKTPVFLTHSFFCMLLCNPIAMLQAGNLTEGSEVYWQPVSGNDLPDNALPLLIDNGIHYFSCRPVYFGRDPGLIRLFKSVRGTVGFEPNGMMTCDYLIYTYGSLTSERTLASYLPDNHDDILDQFSQIHLNHFLYSGRTSPGTPFELLSTSDGNPHTAQISYTSESFEESTEFPSRKLFLADISDSNSPFQLNGSLVQCQGNSVRVELGNDIFCVPKAEYCRKTRPPYFLDDIFFSESDASTTTLHWHDVIGISFVSKPADFVSERCYWHQEPLGPFEELTAGLSGFQKVLITLSSLSESVTPTAINTTVATEISKITSLSTQSQDLSVQEDFARAVTVIGVASTLGIPIAICITILLMCQWHSQKIKTLDFMQPTLQTGE